MAKTLSSILIDVNSYVDLEASLPTGSELTTRSNYANQAVWDASALAHFPEFSRIYEVDPATNATISMPSNFKELESAPRQRVGGGWTTFPEIAKSDRFSYSDGDKYCYKLGNPSSGYVLVFNGLEANMTISVDYQRFPSGLLTLTDVCELSDPQYVERVIESKILQSRSDDRFPTVEADAQRKLKNLVGRGMKALGGGVPTIKKVGIANYVLE